MDVYGLTTPEVFRIDDLLDFSNEDLISSTTTCTDSTLLNHHHQQQQHFSPPENPYNYHRSSSSAAAAPTHSTDFTDDLCVPSDDVAELEWLSRFVDDSFSDFPANELTGTVAFRSDTSFTGRARSKRSRAASTTKKWCSSPESEATMMIGKSKTASTAAIKLEMTSSSSEINNNCDWSSSPAAEVRRCTHCASEKTPQWRTGPLGPKTLCNACGVRYKSGRLVPEYRPAASPTFVLTQHSNSHRKVMELRRQKEMMHQDEQQQQQQQQRQFYRHHHHHHHDFEVC